jgi:hypothetical protein
MCRIDRGVSGAVCSFFIFIYDTLLSAESDELFSIRVIYFGLGGQKKRHNLEFELGVKSIIQGIVKGKLFWIYFACIFV